MKRFNVGFWGCIEESKDGLFVLAEDAVREIDGLNEYETELIIERNKLVDENCDLNTEVISLKEQRQYLVKKIKRHEFIIVLSGIAILLDFGMYFFK